jgi:uncharacterized damage-inducible protein DinB
MFAAYNAWANDRLYAAVHPLGDALYRMETGAAFGSLHGTLNHLLTTDRIWMKRFTGTGDAPACLDAILFESFADLKTARAEEDLRIAGWIDTLSPAVLAGVFTYTPISIPEPVTQPLGPCLAHLFNHQTHHRGQCHMILTSIGQPGVVLDLVTFLRMPEGRRWGRKEA